MSVGPLLRCKARWQPYCFHPNPPCRPQEWYSPFWFELSRLYRWHSIVDIRGCFLGSMRKLCACVYSTLAKWESKKRGESGKLGFFCELILCHEFGWMNGNDKKRMREREKWKTRFGTFCKHYCKMWKCIWMRFMGRKRQRRPINQSWRWFLCSSELWMSQTHSVVETL